VLAGKEQPAVPAHALSKVPREAYSADVQSETLTEILEWSTRQPAWQRDALRRLFATGRLAAEDMDDLVELCKARHGLLPARDGTPLSKEHLAIGGEAEFPVSLVAVSHQHGVNALAADQTVSFGPHLTIVYGQNAAGKSGYSRILKKACRSRSDEEILGNVLSGVPLKAEATIRYRLDTDEQLATWRPDAPPPPALAAISVFDAQCAPVYLRDKTDVAFRPFSLDVFDRLSAACVEVKKRLDTEYAALDKAAPVLPKVAEETRVAAMLRNLTSLTKADEVCALSILSEQEGGSLKQLEARRRDLLAEDPAKKARELVLRASRVEAVSNHLRNLVAQLGSEALEALRTKATSVATARASLVCLRETLLAADLLPGTGGDAWRKMWEAAAAFSGEAYPGTEFPAIEEDARCALCQQPLGEDAVTRFRHFQELVSSTAQADVRAAEKAYAEAVTMVRDLTVEPEVARLAVEEIGADDPALAEGLRTFLAEAQGTKDAIIAATSSSSSLPAGGAGPSPVDGLDAMAKSLRERAAALQKQTPGMDPKDAADLSELQARVTLGENLQAVTDEIERRQRLAAYKHCIDDTNTQGITRKSTDLTKRLVTDRLRNEFRSELQKLEFDHLSVEIQPVGGSRGALFHHLVFSNAPGVQVSRVLSEGESRALSLAAFLSELSTASVASAIIFDDPVSSLDHIWRERIARRLAGEAIVRQVVVFTHDLVFLKCLVAECERMGVPFLHQCVRRLGDEADFASADLPWLAMRLKDRLGVLRARWQTADKLFRDGDMDEYERNGREIFGLLREAWEQGVVEVLLHDVVERYRPSIETRKVRVLFDITEEDCDAVEAGMTECSRWIRGHDAAAAEAGPFPKSEEVSERIEELASWAQRIRKRREGKKPG